MDCSQIHGVMCDYILTCNTYLYRPTLHKLLFCVCIYAYCWVSQLLWFVVKTVCLSSVIDFVYVMKTVELRNVVVYVYSENEYEIKMDILSKF